MKTVLNDIPANAINLSVFAIKDSSDSPTGKQAFIGWYLPNGNFHYIGVPFENTPKKLNLADSLVLPTNISSPKLLSFEDYKSRLTCKITGYSDEAHYNMGLKNMYDVIAQQQSGD